MGHANTLRPSSTFREKGTKATLLMGTALQATVMLVLSQPAGAQPAPNARPLGGSVVGGSATISRTPNNTAINQSTQRAAIDWKSFDVGSQQRVTFNQPSSSAATLNRVTGPDPSQIAGRIDANGQVVLLNQSGVVFYKGAQVNTNGLVVSAIGMSNQGVKGFLDTGKLALDQAGNPNARVENQGTITIKQAGLAALVAPEVANSGVINAKLGHVVLAGAKTATLDLYGDGLLSLDVTNQVTQAPVNKDGTTATALVTNTGVIIADGGTVQLTARAADGIVQNLVRAGGKIRAATMGDQTGSVALNGVGGSVIVEGQLSAPGNAPGTTGGNIEVVSNRNVTIASGAQINASGKAGGGVVAIGTTLARAKGGPSVTPTMTAANTFIQSDARIRADAGTAGNGGIVTVLATSATTMAGAITARGGPQGGNGGLVEISGDQLGLSGQVDVSAPKGTIGTILLDPSTLEIINGAKGAGDQDGNLNPTGTILANGADTPRNQVSNGEIDSLTGSIVLQAQNDLSIDNNTPITLLPNASLALEGVKGDIVIGTGSPITASGTGSIQVLAGGALTLDSNLATASAGSITLKASSGIALNGVSITTGVLDLSNSLIGGVTQSAAGGITASTIQSSGGVFGSVSLLGANNAITNVGDFKVVLTPFALTPGDFALSGDSSTDIVGRLSIRNATINESGGAGVSVTGIIAAAGTVSISAGPIALETTAVVQGTTITLSGNNAALNGNAVLGNANQTALLDVTTSAGDFTEASSATINATTLNSTGGVAGNVSLLGINAVSDLGNISVTGNLAMRDTLALTVNGTVSAPSGSTFLESSATTGGITIAAGGAVRASASGRASFQAGVLDILPANTFAVAGTVSAGTFELAVDIPGDTLTLGPGGALASLAGITASQLRFGAVTQPGSAVATTAGGIALSGIFDIQNLPLELDATGLVTDTAAPLINVGTLTGNAGTVALTNGNNTITNLGNFTTGGDFALTDAGALTVIGAVAAGAPAAPNAGNTAALALVTGGALQIGVGGGAAGSLNAGNVALTAGGAISEPNGSIATNSLAASTTGNGGDVSLISTGNQINASTGISATNGSVILVDDPTLVLTGNYSGANLFFEVAAAGDGIALGTAVTPATLTVPLGGRISLVADNITATAASLITAPAGTLELAPFSAIPVSVAGNSGAGQLLVDTTLLSVISTGTSALDTLLIGAFTNIPAGATTAATSANKITIDGAVDLTNSTTNLGLFANGPITEPGGPLAVTNVFGTTSAAGGDFALSNAGNAIADSTGITATNGNVVVVDGTDLTLFGAHTGNNLFYEIAAAGGTLTLGNGQFLTTLTAASGGRASLVADNIVDRKGAKVIAPAGTVELAPFSAINTSLFGASGLVISPGLVSIITTSTLVAGGFTNVPGGATTSAPSASTVTVDGAVDLTGIAATLEVEATGAITEPGGPLTVTNLAGSGGSVQLLNAANKISTLETLKATTGDLSLADASPLTIDGAVTAFGNVYLTTPSIAIAATGTIGASPTGRVSLQTDAASIAGPITGGTFEFAPFTGGGTVRLGTSGDLVSLLDVTVGSARIGAVTLPGGGAPTTTAGAITTVGTFDANNLPVELDSTGAVAGAAFPIINVATLSGSAGAVTLDDPNNTVANLGNFTATSFGLADAIDLSVIGAVSGGTNASITDTGTLTIAVDGAVRANAVGLTAGNITIAGLVSDGGAGTTSLVTTVGTISETGTLVAGTLTGSSVGTVALSGDNTVAALGASAASPFSAVGQSFTLVDNGAASLAVNGLSAATVSVTALAISIPGALSGTTSVALAATEGGISETGTVTTPLLTGSSAGTVGLTGTNTIAAVGASAASPFDAVGQSFALVDGGAASLAVNGLSAAAISLTAPVVSIPGALIGTTGVALAATGGGISETGTVTTPLLTGSAAGTVDLAGSNTIAGLGASAASPFSAVGQSFTLVDGGAASLAVNGLSAATVSLTAPVITVPGALAGTTSVTLVATGGGISETGTVTTPLLSGRATGAVGLSDNNQVTDLGNFTTGGDFALTDAGALTVIGAVAAGTPAAPNAGNTATLTLSTGGALQIGVGGGAAGSLNAGNVALTAGGAITEPNGSIATNSFAASTTGAGGDVSLTSTSNQISASTGISATNGSVILVDDPTLVLTGAYSGANLFFEVVAPGDGIALGTEVTPATLTVLFGGRISLVADNITATAASQITAPGGTLELAPFSPIPVSVAGSSSAGQLLVDTTLLSIINTGTSKLDTLLIGAFTNIPAGATVAATSASKITVDGAVDLTNSATNLGLFASGPITEPGGPLAVFNVFGTTSAVGGDFALSNAGNAITESTGITATNGNVAVVDGTDLTLLGAHTGNNLFYEIAAADGTLTLGNGQLPTTLKAASGGRVSLVADNIVGNEGASVIAPAGTVELAPFSAINTSLFGASGLVISPGLLSIIATSTLVAGGFTNVPAGATTSAPSASTVTVDGAVDLTGIASTLEVEATGAITEPGGPLTVTNLAGSGGSVQLLNAANKIATLETLKATAGDLSLADASPLTIDGAVTAFGNVYLTAPGSIAIAATGSIGASPIGRVSLQTDAASIAGPITGGTFEFAPFTGGGTVTLGIGGDLASLLDVTVGSARIGAVTLPGGGAPTTTASAITTVGTFDANNLPVELDATGAIAGAAFPIINVATLSGSAGAVALDNAANTVGNLGNFTATSFDLGDAIDLSVIGTVAGGSSATITDAGSLTIVPGGAVTANAVGLTAGNITIAGLVSDGGAGTTSLVATAGTISATGTLIAGTLTGSSAGTVFLTGFSAVAALGASPASPFNAVGQSFTLLQGGGNSLVVNGLNAATVDLEAAAISIPGALNGAFNVNLVATGGGISETGSLTTGALTGSAKGPVDLTGTNAIAAVGSGFPSSFNAVGQSFTLVDAGAPELAVNGLSAATVSLTAPVINVGTLIGTSSVALTATDGGISEGRGKPTIGSLIAGTLSGSATGTANLDGINQIGTLGNFTASGLGLGAGSDLIVTGAVNGGPFVSLLAGALTIASGGTVSASQIFLEGSSIAIPGVVTDGGNGTVTLLAFAGTISETGNLTAGTLSGSATGATSLTGTNRVGALGNFTASNFVLTDTTDLLIGGTLSAGNIAIRAPANQVSLGDGATIVVGGTVRPSGPIQAALEPANGGPGADIQAAGFTQINSSTVTGRGGGPATLQISVTGNMQFDPPLGLQATGTWLILDLTNGTAAGNVFVNALDVSYTVPGGTNLFGTINGVSGGPAAGIASIQPAINANYLFNRCIIATATCQPATQAVFRLPNEAITSALGGLYPFLPGSPPPLVGLPNLVLVVAPMLPAPPRQLTDPDVVPPNISYLDY